MWHYGKTISTRMGASFTTQHVTNNNKGREPKYFVVEGLTTFHMLLNDIAEDMNALIK